MRALSVITRAHRNLPDAFANMRSPKRVFFPQGSALILHGAHHLFMFNDTCVWKCMFFS
jgi:hypothetical protein